VRAARHRKPHIARCIGSAFLLNGTKTPLGGMETERITLSQRERDRLKVLHEVQQKHLSQVAAAERLKVTDRQVRRMLLRIREHGDGALVHGLRGRPSNRKLAAGFEQKVLGKTGERVDEFFASMVDLIAREEITQERQISGNLPNGMPGDCSWQRRKCETTI
jgi:hypothetical protein